MRANEHTRGARLARARIRPVDPKTLAANLIRLIDDDSLRLALADDADCTVRLFEAQYRAAVASHGGGE